MRFPCPLAHQRPVKAVLPPAATLRGVSLQGSARAVVAERDAELDRRLANRELGHRIRLKKKVSTYPKTGHFSEISLGLHFTRTTLDPPKK